jgi:DNA-binding response OmpR family regulator
MKAVSILIVEDDAILGEVLAAMLEEMGFDVCAIATTEDDAVADARRCKPGLIIVDEQLREGNGVSAMERILRTESVPCVFISGAPKDSSRTGKTVLQKPFAAAELARAIRNVIGGAGLPALRITNPGCVVPGH